MTVRRHPDDDPLDPAARRAIKTDDDIRMPWRLVTGRRRVSFVVYSDGQVADWPVTHSGQYGTAFRPVDRHRQFDYDGGLVVTCSCGARSTATTRSDAGLWWQLHRRTVAGRAERGDMDVDAFKGGATS